jgi:hypothetical protein
VIERYDFPAAFLALILNAVWFLVVLDEVQYFFSFSYMVCWPVMMVVVVGVSMGDVMGDGV